MALAARVRPRERQVMRSTLAMNFMPFPRFAVPIWPATFGHDKSHRSSTLPHPAHLSTKLVDNVRQNRRAKSRCGITLEIADAQFCSSDRFAVGNFEVDSGHFVAFF